MLLPLFILPALRGQTGVLSGAIVDGTSSRPLPGAVVRITDSGGRLLEYAVAAADGSFAMEYDLAGDSDGSFTAHVQLMGYRTCSFPLEKPMPNATIRLQAEPTRLRDVAVEAPAIEQRSDTLVYYTSKYAREHDRSIADVLKRLPGIEIDGDGAIKYNGEPINKFYIDGSDFADGRYNLATENLPAEDVAAVEVIENHQPLRVLQGLEFSNQAGLNIKLKEDARQRWAAIASAALGAYPLLGDASLFAMRISGKWQNMESARVNNTGWDPAPQTALHTADQLFGNNYRDELWDYGISLEPAAAPLDGLRARDNLSTLASTANSWHAEAKDFDVKLNAAYSADRLDYVAGYTTEYLDPDIPTFTQASTMRTHAHTLSGQWALQANRPELYLKENLCIDAGWHRALSQSGGTTSLAQYAETSSLALSNELRVLKRIGKRLLSISSLNRYTQSPQWLSVTSAGTSMAQQVLSGDLRTVTEVRCGWMPGKWNISARGGIDYDLHRLQSNLEGVDIGYPTSGDDVFSLLDIYLSPEASRQTTRWQLTAAAPVSYKRYAGENYISLAPELYARWQLNAKTDVSARLSYALLPAEPSRMIAQAIMTDYRNIRAGYPARATSRERSVTVSARHRNPVASFFANLSARYAWDASPVTANQLFAGEQVLLAYVPEASDARTVQVYGQFSKGLRQGRTTVGAEAGHMQLRAATMLQGVRSPYVVTSSYIRPSVKAALTRRITADYSLAWTCNVMDAGGAGRSSCHIIKQTLAIAFTPAQNWQAALGAEHYYARFDSAAPASLLLIDVSVSWRISKRAELGAAATNLLNEKQFRYMAYGLMSKTEYTWNIRGCNVLANVRIRI